jgi:hypothetical protein
MSVLFGFMSGIVFTTPCRSSSGLALGYSLDDRRQYPTSKYLAVFQDDFYPEMTFVGRWECRDREIAMISGECRGLHHKSSRVRVEFDNKISVEKVRICLYLRGGGSVQPNSSPAVGDSKCAEGLPLQEKGLKTTAVTKDWLAQCARTTQPACEYTSMVSRSQDVYLTADEAGDQMPSLPTTEKGNS